jgi:two-component system chemotaxis sensor kinase CheA
MDYSFFDGLIDSVFVINDAKGIVYCNEAAAKLCDSSVRRLAKGKPIYETIEFSDSTLFVMPEGTVGQNEPAPYVELKFKLKAGKEGKVQVAIQPFTEATGDKRWVIMVRDVTIEEVLHAKYHKQLEEKEVYILQLQEAQKKLEDYSKNLEHMVEERTQEVKRANLMLNAIMNSLGQGFFVFDQKGKCENFYTKACQDILEGIPAQRSVWEVLKVPPKELDTFQMWLQAIYGEQLPFETLKELGPNQFIHSQNKHVVLDYFPLRDENEMISNVVVVATDQTSEYLANQALDKEKKYVQMVLKLVTNKKQFFQFISNAEATIESSLRLVNESQDEIDHEGLFRALHTLEGEAGTCSATEVWSASRRAQEVIEPLKMGEKTLFSALKPQMLKELSNLKESLKQFQISNADLFKAIGLDDGGKIEVSVRDVDVLLQRLARAGASHKVICEVEDQLLREPVWHYLKHYEDAVVMVASKLGKQMLPLTFVGADVKLHMNNYSDLFSSLIHAYRNAVDHGIEPAEEREMMGKSPAGLIQTQVERFSNGSPWVRIVISDDGAGISAERLKASVLKNNPQLNVDHMTEYEIHQLVFESGISTKSNVEEFSGRGIGMNAIKAEAEALGGRAWVNSETGRGTQLIIEVPDLPRLASFKKAA